MVTPLTIDLQTPADSSNLARPIRVLHVIPQLGAGGAERVAVSLLNSLDPEICKTRLCVLGSINAFPSRLNFPEAPVFLGYSGSLKDVRGMRRCIGSLRSLIKEGQYDVVHSHLWPAARLAGLAASGSNVAHIAHIHDMWPWLQGRSIRDRMLRVFTRYALRSPDTVFIAVAEAVRKYTTLHLSTTEAAFQVVPNGISPEFFHPISQRVANGRPLRIGTVARFTSEKGHKYLIQAFAEISGKLPAAELHLAGEGSEQPACETLAAKLGIRDKVKFRGLVRDIPGFLHDLDLFVLPSISEGLPLTILEAMATALPVIAGNIAGNPEVIRNGENGILVPPKDIPALSSAIEKLAGNASLRHKLGENALRTVRERFSLERVCREIENVYRNVIVSRLSS